MGNALRLVADPSVSTVGEVAPDSNLPEGVQEVRLPGLVAWAFGDSPKLYDASTLMELVDSTSRQGTETLSNGPTLVGAWLGSTPKKPDIAEYLALVGLPTALDVATDLLKELKGPASYVTPFLRAERESGEWRLIFDMHTPNPTSFRDEEEFLELYVSRLDGAESELAPVLIWNPSRRASHT